MNVTLKVNEDGSGELDGYEFKGMAESAKQAINGPTAMNGEPNPGEYQVDEEEPFAITNEGTLIYG